MAIIERACKEDPTAEGRVLDDLTWSVLVATLMAHGKLAKQAQKKVKPVPGNLFPRCVPLCHALPYFDTRLLRTVRPVCAHHRPKKMHSWFNPLTERPRGQAGGRCMLVCRHVLHRPEVDHLRADNMPMERFGPWETLYGA